MSDVALWDRYLKEYCFNALDAGLSPSEVAKLLYLALGKMMMKAEIEWRKND